MPDFKSPAQHTTDALERLLEAVQRGDDRFIIAEAERQLGVMEYVERLTRPRETAMEARSEQ